ncbi:pyridoxamine 5'-phosphate oxidase [Ornithinicoccus halotolerans]|uniref:pyridoxamine 5'-phosphate oxidase n=1 Tax=Ornithinicoccus halotolerans TaxID=1748220 RepID=UPI001296529D|nr:pyridoxamine 5'-phosphate oxidase [Ornithinicoccus halotolerans]
MAEPEDSLRQSRVDYAGPGLGEQQLAPTPYEQLVHWLEEAVRRQADRGDVPEPYAMALATVDEQGRPDVRTVLMRLLTEQGPGFVTNLQSAKGRQLARVPFAAATMTWPAMYRAVRFRGPTQQVPRGEIERYFARRPWGSRVSAWASAQSAPVAGRAELEEAFAAYAARFPDHGRDDDVPVPAQWGGVRIIVTEVEFWAGRPNRLHDRLRLTRDSGVPGTLATPGVWQVQRLQP